MNLYTQSFSLFLLADVAMKCSGFYKFHFIPKNSVRTGIMYYFGEVKATMSTKEFALNVNATLPC